MRLPQPGTADSTAKRPERTASTGYRSVSTYSNECSATALPGGLSFEELTRAAGAEVHGVWACRSDEPTVVADVDWQSLGESFAMQLFGSGIERDL